MLFEARDLKPCGEPVTADQLREGEVYFNVLFLYENGLIPFLEPKVFIGRDLEPGDVGKCYFQDYVSYRRGVRYDSPSSDNEADFEVGLKKCTYEYARALDVLMYCELMRRRASARS